MWKINISMDDATTLSELLKNYQASLPAGDSKRDEIVSIKAKLDDLIVVVQEENRIVAEYIEQIRSSQGAGSNVRAG